MKTPLLVAAACAALPGCALQDPAAPAVPGTEAFAAGCPMHDTAPRAASALPARASTRPEPQLGSVAPDTRVPSQAVTPSTRAMERALAAQAGGSEKNTTRSCHSASAKPAPKEGAG